MILFLSPLCRFLSLQIQKKNLIEPLPLVYALHTSPCQEQFLGNSGLIPGTDTNQHLNILYYSSRMSWNFFIYICLYILKVFKVTSIVNIHILGDNLYVWLYNPVPWYCSYPNLAILCSILALVLSPMWPSEMRSYTSINNKLPMLKGLSHEIDFKKCWQKFTELGLSKGRVWFLNYLGASIILKCKKYIYCGKCKFS
jgi:hypothetical protein